jgi:transposase
VEKGAQTLRAAREPFEQHTPRAAPRSLGRTSCHAAWSGLLLPAGPLSPCLTTKDGALGTSEAHRAAGDRPVLTGLGPPQPWQGTVDASLRLIDELDREITECERELRRLGADHRYVPLLLTVPGISWVLAYTIAAELGDIGRFATPRKLAGYSGLCPRVYQSGERDLRGPLAKQGPRYLRWALVEAATHACTHPIYRERYQHTKARIGKQRGAKVAQIDLARRLAEAIWHMLTRNQPFAPAGATDPLAA